MLLDKNLARAQEVIPGCLAAAYVDIGTGMLLAIKTVDPHPEELLDTVAAAAAEFFQGSSVRAIDRAFRHSGGAGDEGSHSVKEIVVLSDNLIHVFLRARGNAEQVAVFVTRVTANLGLVLVRARQALAEIEHVA